MDVDREVRAQRPLHGVVLCCTSILYEKREQLTGSAKEMGATIKLDLTSDVTHLIVGGINTPKYKYVAGNRPDVQCLLPEWIEAVLASWKEGGDTDVKRLEEKYKLPTFYGLKICVTGVEDPDHRKRFEELVNANSGEYRGDLTKEISYLVAFKAAGNKYSHAKLWGIPTVSLEWFYDSLQRGMVLDEAKYDPQMPQAERGKDAWIRPAVSNPSLAKRAREDEVTAEPPRKLRKTMSAKLGQQNDQIWTDIVGSGSEKKLETKGEWEDKPVAINVKPIAEQASHIGLGTSILKTRKVPEALSETASRQRYGFFGGKFFYVYGFDERKATILRSHLSSQSASVVGSVTELPYPNAPTSFGNGFILVPHSSHNVNDLSTSEDISRAMTVTDFWVESCLHKDMLVQPDTNVLYTPFSYPIKGFEDFTISSTAFQGVDLLHLSKAVILLGATYDEYLTPETSILICNADRTSQKKLAAALDWNVPAVRADWLWDCIRSRQVEPFDQYLIFPEKQAGLIKIQEDESPGENISKAAVSKSITSRYSKGSKKASSINRHQNSENSRTKSTDLDPHKSFEKIKLLKTVTSSKSHEAISAPSKNRKSINAESSTQPFVVPVDADHTAKAEQSGHESTTQDKLSEEPESNYQTAAASFAAIAPENNKQLPTQQGYDGACSQPNNLPLQEMNPNSPPKRSTPRPRSFDLYKPLLDPLQEQASQLKALSSILAAQRGASKPAANVPSNETRRKKRLLGRAPSNLSTGSGGNPLELSRASSVDTMNTDGLGTPIEGAAPVLSRSHSTPKKQSFGNCKNSITAAALAAFHDDSREDGDGMGRFPMTQQLEYEDPEERAWRERLLKKMNGEKDLATPKAIGKVGIGAKKETVRDVGGSVRKTRHGYGGK